MPNYLDLVIHRDNRLRNNSQYIIAGDWRGDKVDEEDKWLN